MKLRLWLPNGPVAVVDDPFWSVLRPGSGYHRPACFAAIDAGVDIPTDTYNRSDSKASQYQWQLWDGNGGEMGANDTAILPLEVDELKPNGCRWCGSPEGVWWAGWCGVCLAHLEGDWVLTQEEEDAEE